jgi:hypothetical protein
MARQAEAFKMNIELGDIPGTSLKVSPVAIGTWAIGGWMWGGTDEAESVSTIRAALEHGINIIGTAPSMESADPGRSLAGQSPRPACARAGLEWAEISGIHARPDICLGGPTPSRHSFLLSIRTKWAYLTPLASRSGFHRPCTTSL